MKEEGNKLQFLKPMNLEYLTQLKLKFKHVHTCLQMVRPSSQLTAANSVEQST
jgi:hypothetical protein